VDRRGFQRKQEKQRHRRITKLRRREQIRCENSAQPEVGAPPKRIEDGASSPEDASSLRQIEGAFHFSTNFVRSFLPYILAHRVETSDEARSAAHGAETNGDLPVDRDGPLVSCHSSNLFIRHP